MSMYVIASKDEAVLTSPVFHVGSNENDEAIAIFTSSRRADAYIQDAGWQQSETVAELEPAAVLGWLVNAAADGTKILAVDPVRDAQEDVPQPVLSIPELLDELAQIAANRIKSPPPPAPAVQDPVNKLHCLKCGNVVEQELETTIPQCCGQEMTVAAIA